MDIDIESIPLPASVLNRRSASFRHHNHKEPTISAKFKPRSSIPNAFSSDNGIVGSSSGAGGGGGGVGSSNSNNKHHRIATSAKTPTKRGGRSSGGASATVAAAGADGGGGGSSKSDGNRFKLANILNNQKNLFDMHQYPALNHLNAKLKRICRRGAATPSSERRRMPFEQFSIDAETYHELMAKNQPLPMNVNELRDGGIVTAPVGIMRPSMSNLTSTTLAEIQSVHASTCNLVTALRASSQSILDASAAATDTGCGNLRFARHCNSNSAMNLRYDSLRSHKGRYKRSNSEQLNPSYYHFQNIDTELDNNNGAFDSMLLTNHSAENYKLPWKHRQCPSISSSGGNSTSSSNISSTYFTRSHEW